MRPLSGLPEAFLRDRRGNFAIISGLVGAVLVLSLGGAADLSMQLKARTALQAATDAAALAGAKQLETNIDGSPDAVVKAMAAANLSGDLKSAVLTTTVDKAKRLVTVSAAAAVPTGFLPIAGVKSLPVSARSTSSILNRRYTDFFFMLDVSESMNIAASDADRDSLEYWTRIERKDEPCAFACHVSDWYRPKSAYKVARDHGVRLRIDVVQAAADLMFDKILAKNGAATADPQNRITTAGFSWDFATGVVRGTDAAALKTSIRNFPVANQHTRFWWAFSQFNTMVGTQGTGESKTSPEKVAVIVTDGVRDEDFAWWGLGPLDPNLCSTIKDRGIKLAILEIKYVPRPGERFYEERVSWYYPQISANLKKCASDGAYFLATEADQAAEAMAKLTSTLMSDRHLVE